MEPKTYEESKPHAKTKFVPQTKTSNLERKKILDTWGARSTCLEIVYPYSIQQHVIGGFSSSHFVVLIFFFSIFNCKNNKTKNK